MRILLLSDIHSNLVAFQAVLADARQRGGFDAVWNMGDIVGYGPEPVACLELLLELRALSVAGNHDWAVLGKVPLTDFNYIAALANHWTAAQLDAGHKAYLSDLPLTLQQGDFTLVHGSPRDPIWEYILDSPAAVASFAQLATRHGTMGHTHKAAAFLLEPDSSESRVLRLQPGQTLRLRDGRWLINPGSVGQPRDHDPRAAYALLDDTAGTVTAQRVAYDIPATQRRMLELKLPPVLAERLAEGR